MLTRWVSPDHPGIVSDFDALATFTAEASLIGPTGLQPVIRAHTFSFRGARWRFRASGVVSSTGTPTYQFTGRLSSTVGISTVTGTKVGESEAITTGSGITNEHWYYDLLLTCRVPGLGSGTCTVNCTGRVWSGGFAAPYTYELVPATGTPQTWTQTLDNSVDLYFNLTAVCSASSASNTIRCKEIEVLNY